MAINEVFKNPTVTQVIFQMKFPNFFGVEKMIGDIQIDIMERFPRSKLLYSQQVTIVRGVNIPEPDSVNDPQQPSKIWQFSNNSNDIIINITSSSVDITSLKHKTYNSQSVDASQRFRETIEFVSSCFLKHIPVTLLTRVALRYTDNCPLPVPLTKDNFLSFYNSSLNLDSLKIDDISTIALLNNEVQYLSNGIHINYKESLFPNETVPNLQYKYNLDFDGIVFDIKPSILLAELDKIHEQLSICYENIIKEPVYIFMKD